MVWRTALVAVADRLVRSRDRNPTRDVVLDGAVELTAEGDDGLDGNDPQRIRGVDRSGAATIVWVAGS